MTPLHIELNLFPVPGYPDLYVTRDGRVFIYGGGQFYEPKVFEANPNRRGSRNPCVNYRRKDGVLMHVGIKRAMANAFLGKDAPNRRIKLIDGNQMNLTAENIGLFPAKKRGAGRKAGAGGA